MIAMTILFSTVAAPAGADSWSRSLGRAENLHSLSATAGTKSMSGDAWAGADQPLTIGLDWDYTSRDWPLSITAAFFAASGSGKKNGVDTSSRTMETHLGVRKLWNTSERDDFQPYLGGGIALGYGTRDDGDTTDSGYGVGGWLGFGFRVILPADFFLGADIRYAGIPLDLNGHTADAGGLYTALTFGYQFRE
jgi:hypothetical protein